nr:hypothetical protein HK105_008343 [Polyrhizophydium stewartii]
MVTTARERALVLELVLWPPYIKAMGREGPPPSPLIRSGASEHTQAHIASLILAEPTWKRRYESWLRNCVGLALVHPLIFADTHPGFTHNVAKRRRMASNFAARNGFRIPEAYLSLMSIVGIQKMYTSVSPTNDFLCSIPKAGPDADAKRGVGQAGVMRVPRKYRKKVERAVGPCDNLVHFIDENQGCCFWHMAINTADPSMDPPVFLCDCDYFGEEYEEDDNEDDAAHDGDDDDDDDDDEHYSSSEPNSDDEDAESGRESPRLIIHELAAPSISLFMYEHFRNGIDWHLNNPGYIHCQKVFGDGIKEQLRVLAGRQSSYVDYCDDDDDDDGSDDGMDLGDDNDDGDDGDDNGDDGDGDGDGDDHHSHEQ